MGEPLHSPNKNQLTNEIGNKMNNRVLLASLAGGITAFLAGFVFYGLLLKGFFAANTGAATGVAKDPPDLLAIAVGSLAWGLFYALVYDRWARIATLKQGALHGAWTGLLLSVAWDFISFGSSHTMNLTATLTDPVVGAAMGASIGGIVGWALGFGDGK